MGVSVSASTAIIVAGLFFAFTTFYPVASNGIERVSDAQHGVNERALERQNTDFSVTSATFNATTGELTVNATNEGSIGLVADDATLLVGNEYVDVGGSNAATTVDGDADTALWLGDETLSVTVGDTVETDIVGGETRVVLVVESGVRDAATVTEVSA
ncbi:flagellin [Halorubrum ezzemoulense]|uniref:Flagellar protein FlaF n=1 Tax=Halorubrum ezzemoulense TaxID=337243 RepID=A0A256K118_HALEZ|nr:MULTISPECIES: flagellin [Halorubrum]MDB2238359.1 flagellin [Halorubrum ezzemoulense]MDB2239978.1 flagellin [Halorubrum ezzemoulense]MDB2244078.1 flagellin [Halorubrum ezzemoulense]MDB2247828.1 flagellin [Halorubrum ezzemoulense]MDB2260524.1 flagellin [Halorubrum ezzemoulense]